MGDIAQVVLDVLPQARAEFYRRGFDLPLTYLAEVEKSRQRVTGERDFQYYLDAVLQERAKMQSSWSPASRLLVDAMMRSAYLDFLATLADKPAPLLLDQNLKAFWYEGDVEDIRAHRLAFIRQRDEEFVQTKETMDRYIVDPPPSATVLMKRVARDFGFTTTMVKKSADKHTAYRGDIIYSDDNPASPIASINLYDISAFRRQGCVMLGCFLRDHPHFVIGFYDIFPGGSYYVDDHHSLRSTITSFYVQFLFFSILRDMTLEQNDMQPEQNQAGAHGARPPPAGK